jgi:aminopeptidase N
VEYRWGKADALRYLNGLKPKVGNERPIIPPRGTNAEPPQDQYFKAALMINSLRSVINDDPKWLVDLHDFYQQFKYQNIMTEDLERWWSARTGMNLAPFFDEYLRHADIPTLEIRRGSGPYELQYRWLADEPGFAMPIKVGEPGNWRVIMPVTTQWKSMIDLEDPEKLQVPTDLYYVNWNGVVLATEAKP